MKIDKRKFDIALARACKSFSDLQAGVCLSTLSKIRRGEEMKAKTVGKIAQALGCDVLEIIVEE